MSFRFDPISGRPCTGAFELSDSLVRRLFLFLGNEETMYGLRYFNESGTVDAVGLFDSRRRSLQEACGQIGRGERELAHLRSIGPDGTGFTINSPLATCDNDPFQDISDLFLENLPVKRGCYPKQILTTFYLGTYQSGFGLHVDPGEETTLFVLDGTKDFVLADDDGKEVFHTIERNHYLAWRAGQRHGTFNPRRQWSLTINFAVGTPGVNEPVKYHFDKTDRFFLFK